MQPTGIKGEVAAKIYLQRKGYSIIETNYRTRCGEIDIIAQEKDVIVFIEVKSRNSIDKGKPYEAVNNRKIKHIKRTAFSFLLHNDIFNAPLRIDVISIEYKSDGSIDKLHHFKNITI